MRNSVWRTMSVALLLAACCGCSVFQEMNGSDPKSLEKAKAKKEKELEPKKEESHIPPEIASGLNDVEKQEMEAVYKKNASDSKATSKRVFGGWLPN